MIGPMRAMGALLVMTLASGRVLAAERAVVPIEVSATLSAPVRVGPALASGGFLGLPALDWKGADSPAALAAQFFLPPSAIMGFAQRSADAQAPLPSAQSSAAPSRAPLTAGALPEGQGVALPGSESGLLPIEDLGEGSRITAAARPQERLTETETALRAPLGQLRDAPADSGGESLHALSGRVWDLMSGRTGAFARPKAGRAAFQDSGAAPARDGQAPAGAAALSPAAVRAPLEPSSPLAALPRSSPASLALVLMDVVEQKLSLTVARVPRLEPGREVRLVRPEAVPAPYVPGLAAEPARAAALSAHAVPQGALPGADLPSFAWRAEAEWLSFGETTTPSPEGAAGALAAPAASAESPALAAQRSGETFSTSAARPSGRRAPPSPSVARKALSAALPASALLALLGAALLAWPDRR